jgi:hypothetical protein
MSHLILAILSIAMICALAYGEDGTVGPWRPEDVARGASFAEDRPNAESSSIKSKYYRSLIPETSFAGEKGEFRFHIAPRNAGWSGILICNKQGQPVPNTEKLTVTLTGPDGDPVPGVSFVHHDSQILFSDASPIAPKTRISVLRGKEVLDQATIDFSKWTFTPSNVRMEEVLDGPTTARGFVTAKDGRLWRDGKPIFLWGGHENHIPGRGASNAYAETYPEAGMNVQRSIAIQELITDPLTGEIDKAGLDNYHYCIAKLGQRGVYFFMSDAPHGVPGYLGVEKGKSPPDAATYFWLNPNFRATWKKALRTILTTPNPHNNGIALKDDPTLAGFELSNETGMNERNFSFHRPDMPEYTTTWRQAFNAFLVKKYGSRDALAKAWAKHPLLPHEDPAANTIQIPSNYRGARTPHGGTGQHNQFATGRWYLPFGIPAAANPRITDAIEFNKTVAKKEYPFDFNDVTKPEQTQALREEFNAFLLKKYQTRENLAKAWAEDVLFKWEDPAQKTILIPTHFRGQQSYEESDARCADPRVSDVMEFTCWAQREWATDMANFLKKEIGLKCGIGWNGDTFHVVQAPNHMANMTSPLDFAIAAAYQDSDTGEQLTSRTKNLKRFNSYGRIYGRPMFSYEWSYWTNSGPYVHEYCLLASLMGRLYGFDGLAHHKMAAFKYPVADPKFSLPGGRGSYINPLSDRPRRGVLQVASWIMARSRIEEEDQRLIVGFPYHDSFMGGPERRMSNWCFENWLMYQIGTEDYAFKDVYDGPTDRIVIHDGRGPYGDYRKAKHAILWCHANSDREGADPKAKEKWFALHGIKFEPGQKYFINDQFFATTEDMTDYNVVHRAAEAAREKALAANAQKAGKVVLSTTGDHDYWAAEPDFKPTELDRQIYQALKKWGHPLPFAEEEIDRVWRSRDRSMSMDTAKCEFAADRADMQVWFGKLEGKKGFKLSRLEGASTEKQFSAALLPWDTADFATAKTLALWCHWNGEVTVRGSFEKEPAIFAVNWLGQRLFAVTPISQSNGHVTFATARDNDTFCYEIQR